MNQLFGLQHRSRTDPMIQTVVLTDGEYEAVLALWKIQSELTPRAMFH